MGVGVAPATDFLKDSGVNLEKDGGLAVDEYLSVKGLKDVFAVGEYLHSFETETETETGLTSAGEDKINGF